VADEPLDKFEKGPRLMGRCECDTEITAEEMEEGTLVMSVRATADDLVEI